LKLFKKKKTIKEPLPCIFFDFVRLTHAPICQRAVFNYSCAAFNNDKVTCNIKEVLKEFNVNNLDYYYNYSKYKHLLEKKT